MTEFRPRPKRTLFLFSLKNPIRRLIITIIEWKAFEWLVLLTIFTNCCFLAISQPWVDQPTELKTQILNTGDTVFMSVFIFEMCAKIIAYGLIFHDGAYLRSAWNVLDGFVVVTGVFNMIGEAAGVSVANLKALRAFRVLRPLKLVSALESLQMVVVALGKSLPYLWHISLFIGFLLIFFGILGVEFFNSALKTSCYTYSGYPG
eukprot:Colp12_sorted_trinity150504_noHs@11806